MRELCGDDEDGQRGSYSGLRVVKCKVVMHAKQQHVGTKKKCLGQRGHDSDSSVLLLQCVHTPSQPLQVRQVLGEVARKAAGEEQVLRIEDAPTVFRKASEEVPRVPLLADADDETS